MFHRSSRMFFIVRTACAFLELLKYKEKKKILGLCEALHGSARIRSYRRTPETGTAPHPIVTDIFCVLPVNID